MSSEGRRFGRGLKRTCWLLIGIAIAFYLIFFLPKAALPEVPERGYVDMHVHAAGLGYGGSGAYVHPDLVDSWKFPIYLRAFDISEAELHEEGDRVLLKKLSQKIANSLFIERAVVLAMDGAVDERGELDLHRTQLYVPNEYLISELRNFPNLLFGASVNPLRHDSLERLDQAVENGAVLIKWLPNIMHFSPSDERIEPFYRRMVEHCIPLLTHTGAEHSFNYADNSLGDPFRLHLPLSLGVTVIAAHIATTGETDGEAHFERLIPMFEDYPNLYADISSLTQINKIGYLRQALEIESVTERLLYGTDWPLQFFPLVSPYYLLDTVTLKQANSARMLSNLWDRDTVTKKFAGVPEEVFLRFPTLMDNACGS
ncbi:MAG: amidohydrolase family protein [Gammaproteobacteria bacterium]|nr:amidohydrolase family protein [Gammaproteobacteria bacterium]